MTQRNRDERRTLRLVTAATIATAAFALTATPALGADDTGPSGAAMDTAAAADDARPLDRDIALAVDNQLWDRPEVPAHLVNVDSHEGIVTLSGDVPHLLAKQHAQEAAETVRGVRSVVNRIEVKGPDVSDDDLRSDVVKALAIDPATDSYELEVTAKDGTVTLKGTVDSWAERVLCRQVAAGVTGVRDVEDEITLLLQMKRPDSEVAADIERRLEMDVWLDASRLDVNVDQGVVTVTGAVASAAEKKRLRNDAWVSGASKVDVTGVDVRWWEKGPMERTDPRPELSDDVIAAAVEDAFLYDPRVLSQRPKIHVSDGFVTLTGSVSDLAAKRAAEDDARNTRGVWGVRNRLRVRPMEPVEETGLELEARSALVRDPYIDADDVVVEAEDGEVTLHGHVDSVFERIHAEHVVERVTGVMTIANRLSIAPVTVSFKDDLEIRREIRDELTWSPFVDADQVGVTVHDGVATLTGEVDSWHERRMATQNAKEGGAITVVNELSVAGPADDLFD